MLASVNSELQRAPTGLCGSHLASVFTSLEGLQRRAMPLSRPWESRHVWSAHLPLTSLSPLTSLWPSLSHLESDFFHPFGFYHLAPRKPDSSNPEWCSIQAQVGWRMSETSTKIEGRSWWKHEKGAQGLCPSAWIPKALCLWCMCNSCCVKLWWLKCLQSFNGQWLLLLGRTFQVIPHRGQQTRALGSNSAHHQFLSVMFYWTQPWGQIHPATYFCQ